MRITSTAPIPETAQRIIVLRFPHRSRPILSTPGTGGIKRRTATSTTTKVIVSTSAIRLQHYHPEMSMSIRSLGQQFSQIPNMIRDLGFHCRGHTDRAVNPAEIMIREIQCERRPAAIERHSKLILNFALGSLK